MEYTFTTANFDAEVAKATVPVLVDFWAPWCGPCRLQGPILEELADSLDDTKAKVGKLNVDEQGDIAMQFGVMSIPTLIVFKNGKEVERFVGVQEKEVLEKVLAKHA